MQDILSIITNNFNTQQQVITNNPNPTPLHLKKNSLKSPCRKLEKA